MRYWTDGMGRVELALREADIAACSHAGDCEVDARRVVHADYMALQLGTVQDSTLVDVLSEYGAWDPESDLGNRELNLVRLVWLAACDLAEEDRCSRD